MARFCVAVGVTACTALLTVALRGSVEVAFAGLALAYASQLSGIFQYTVRLSTETEARFTSVERINNYIKVSCRGIPNYFEVKIFNPIYCTYLIYNRLGGHVAKSLGLDKRIS